MSPKNYFTNLTIQKINTRHILSISDEAESFNNEWTSKTRQILGAIRAPHYRPHNYNYQDNEVLALPSTVPRLVNTLYCNFNIDKIIIA